MATPPPEKHRYKLERPFHVRYKLQRLIAEGEHSNAQLGRLHGVTAEAIREFGKRHADAIAHIKAHLHDEYAGMWIAEKNERLQRYQNTAEILERQIEAVDQGQTVVAPEGGDSEDDDSGLVTDVSGPLSRLTRALNNTLRAVAEERGQLPTRMLVKAEGGGAVHVYGSDVDTSKV
jgi:hypothetical protein